MNITRRGFLQAILAAGVAPAVVKVASLMPVRRLESGLAVPDAWFQDDIVRQTPGGLVWTAPRGVSGVWISAVGGGGGGSTGKMISPTRDDRGNIYNEAMAVPPDGIIRVSAGDVSALTAQWITEDGVLTVQELR